MANAALLLLLMPASLRLSVTMACFQVGTQEGKQTI